MASTSEPRIYTFKAAGVIAKGQAVKAGADREHVALAAAATDKLVGLAQGDTAAAEEFLEVALPGGGAKGKLGGTVAFGDLLTSDGSGNLVATTTANDRVIGVAMEAGVSGDIIAVEAQISNV
jgi:hypothetical protein